MKFITTLGIVIGLSFIGLSVFLCVRVYLTVRKKNELLPKIFKNRIMLFALCALISFITGVFIVRVSSLNLTYIKSSIIAERVLLEQSCYEKDIYRANSDMLLKYSLSERRLSDMKKLEKLLNRLSLNINSESIERIAEYAKAKEAYNTVLDKMDAERLASDELEAEEPVEEAIEEESKTEKSSDIIPFKIKVYQSDFTDGASIGNFTPRCIYYSTSQNSTCLEFYDNIRELFKVDLKIKDKEGNDISYKTELNNIVFPGKMNAITFYTNGTRFFEIEAQDKSEGVNE